MTLLFFVLTSIIVLSTAQSNISTVILENGYPVEVHEATTPDGFILQLFRIPFGKNSSNPPPKKVILLQHGLGSCCADWFLNFPYQSLGFILADDGYDVWIGNNRGNGYSMRHTTYNPSQPEFWYWTWDEMAQYDYPTEIDYILSVTGQSSLTYLGISQGTCQAFAAFSENPEISKKINLFIAFAPVAYLQYEGSAIISVLAELNAAVILEILGEREANIPALVHNLLPGFCEAFPEDCVYAMSALMGPSVFLNTSRIGFYVDYEMAPTSVWNMIHWSQGVNSAKYQHMDWGTQENIKRYGQPTPPLYNLSSIPTTLPIALFTGGNDYLADPRDVARLVQELPTKPVLIYNKPLYSHIDYVLSVNAWREDYPTLLNLIKKYNV